MYGVQQQGWIQGLWGERSVACTKKSCICKQLRPCVIHRIAGMFCGIKFLQKLLSLHYRKNVGFIFVDHCQFVTLLRVKVSLVKSLQLIINRKYRKTNPQQKVLVIQYNPCCSNNGSNSRKFLNPKPNCSMLWRLHSFPSGWRKVTQLSWSCLLLDPPLPLITDLPSKECSNSLRSVSNVCILCITT